MGDSHENGDKGALMEDLEPLPAVVVEQGFKNYGSTPILMDFNMCVPQHTIYGLLGASGCGKTTILSCIVALRRLDSGRIFVCGWPTGAAGSGVPGRRVGYMPQEIALNGEFKMGEVLEYFGRIYGMSQAYISERYENLIQLLNLENCSGRLVRDLSEGQKRRVSVAVALLHEPELLILDEPTVGCDPLLRANIWKFLTELVAERKTTVIVTTHYIEETRQADRVGLMRGGRLLCEAAPSELLRAYGGSCLDDIVLQLCLEDEKACEEDNAMDSVQTEKSIPRGFEAEHKMEDPLPDSGTTISDRLRALVIKNAVVLSRNLMFLLLIITMPSIVVSVFCFSVGSDPVGMPMGVVNHEIAQCGPADMELLQCENVNLSCLFQDSINARFVNLVPFISEEAAVAEVRAARLWGYISFSTDFSQHMFPRLLLGKRNNVTLQGSQIRVRLDMSSGGIALSMKKHLMDAFREFSNRLLRTCGVDPAGRDLPITFETPIFGHDVPGGQIFGYGTPGVALGAVFFVSALTCGLTYLLEKKDGMINRTRVAGVSTVEIMVSHFVVQLVIVCVQAALVLAALLFVFGVTCEGSLLLAAAILLLTGVSGMSVGFLAATFFTEEKNAMLVACGTVLPSFILSGLLFPIETSPPFIQLVSVLLPATLTGEAFRSVLLRGFGLMHHVVWKGCLVGVGWTAVYWILIVATHRLQPLLLRK